MDLRKHLKNGVFGQMDNDELFVIVDDKFIYYSGGFDWVSDADKNLHLATKKVEVLIDACSFNNLVSKLASARNKAIYDRRRPKYKIGNIVELNRYYYGLPKGARGEIVVGLSESRPTNYGVDFKFKYDSTHRLAGALAHKTGLYVPEEVLKLVD